MEAIQATSNPWETEKGGDEKEGGEQFVEVEMTPMGEEGGEEEEMKSGESLLPVMAGGLAGNVLEWYDFRVYAAVAQEIGNNFFPSDNPTAQTIGALAVFAGSFIMRPVGGAILGALGDRKGRKFALVLSVLMMAVTSFLMGIMPTYGSIGLWATLLLSLLKLVQGLSVGGEMVGSMLFLCEFSPKEERGFYGSTVMCSAAVGIALGVMIVAFLRQILTEDQMFSFGWRIPFLSGVIIAGVAIWVRTSLEEPPAFKELKEKNKISENPIRDAFVHHWRLVGLVVLCTALFAVSSWTTTGFLPYNYLPNEDLVYKTTKHSGVIATIAILNWAIWCIVFGKLTDKLGSRTKILFVGSICLGIGWIFAFYLFSFGSVFFTSIAYFGVTIGLASVSGPAAAWMCELFPSSSRYTAIALGYNLGQAIFGGSAPLILTGIAAHDPTTANIFLGIYIFFISLISASFLAYVMRMKKQQKQEEEKEGEEETENDIPDKL